MQELNVKIKSEYIELYKLLKWQNLVNSGGEAKILIENGEVMLNNNIEYRKSKKIYPKDEVIFNNTKIIIS